MHHRSHAREEGLLPGGPASWGPAPSGGLHPRVVCIQGVCIQWELGRPSTPQQHGIRSISGRYTSYWNAFLFYFFRFLIKAPFHSQIDHLRFPFSMHKNSQVFALKKYADWPIRSIVSEPIWVFPWSWLVVQKCVIILYFNMKKTLGNAVHIPAPTHKLLDTFFFRMSTQYLVQVYDTCICTWKTHSHLFYR